MGIVIGVGVLSIAFIRLRTYKERRSGIWSFIVSGSGLILISLFPGLVDAPTELISLGEIPGGRIITILVMATIFLSFFILSEKIKSNRLVNNFNRLVRKTTVKDFLLEYDAVIAQKDRIFILIPAYNEADNLEKLLPKINSVAFKLQQPFQSIVVNDGSNDETPKIAKEHGALVANHPFNLGGGAALLAGYDIVECLGGKMIITMDADGQHNPEDIPALIDPILNNSADIVIGSRFLGSDQGNSMIRSFGVKLYSFIINKLMGLKITDCSSGFRAIDLSRLKEVKLVEKQYHTTELIIDAAKKGFRIVERPVTISERLSGYSKKGPTTLYALRVLIIIIKTWLR